MVRGVGFPHRFTSNTSFEIRFLLNSGAHLFLFYYARGWDFLFSIMYVKTSDGFVILINENMEGKLFGNELLLAMKSNVFII